MSVNPAQDEVQQEAQASAQDQAATADTSPANVNAAPANQTALTLNIMGSLLRGQKVTAEDIPAQNLGPLNDIIGAFIDESQIGGYIENNADSVRDTIMAKLSDPAVKPEDNLLVKIITDMQPQQLDKLLEENPQFSQIVTGIIQEQTSPDKLTVAVVLDQMKIAHDGLESIADLKLTELTPESLKDIPNQVLIDMAFKLPDTSVPESDGVEAVPGGFGIVAKKLNDNLLEAGLDEVTFPADATFEQRNEIFNAALEQLVQHNVDNAPLYKKIFVAANQPEAAYPERDHSQAHLSIKDGGEINAETQAPDYHAAFRAQALDNMAEEIRKATPAAIVELTQDIKVDASRIQGFVAQNPDAVVAALQDPKNQEKLRNALTTEFLVNNAAMMKPYAGEFMQGGVSNMLAGFINQMSDHPIFGGLIESMQSMFAQFSDKFGLGNMFADLGLGGDNGPAQSSLRNQYGEVVDPSGPPQADNTNAEPVQNAKIDAAPYEQQVAMAGPR